MSGEKKSSTTGTMIGTAIILLLLLLIIIALIILLRGGESAPQETPLPVESLEPTPVPTVRPSPIPTVAPSTYPTPEPSPSEEPTPEPEESAKPSDEPKASPTNVPPPDVGPVTGVSGSGSFSSNTGTSLNTQVSWSAVVNSDSTVTVEVRLLLGSCRLNMMPQNSGATITIGGESFSCYTPAIDKEDNELSLTWLSAQSATLPYTKGMSIPISTSFNYGGSYNGVAIGTITAEGTAIIG